MQPLKMLKMLKRFQVMKAAEIKNKLIIWLASSLLSDIKNDISEISEYFQFYLTQWMFLVVF